MKTMIALSLMSLSFSSFAAVLLPVSNPRIVITRGPQFAAVQPTAHIEFVHNSCGKKNFSVSLEESREADNTTLVKFETANAADCRAVGVDRTYRLQVSSDADPSQKYVVLNPIPTTMK